MILLYCFDIEERFRLYDYFSKNGIRLECVLPSEFRIRSYSLGTDAILIAGNTPYGFISEINPAVPLITIGEYPLGESVNFKKHTDPRLIRLLSSFPEASEVFDYNGILYSSSGEVIFLGYELKLTGTEKTIVSFLISQKDRDASCKEIAEVCGDPHLKASTITKHISSINSKSKIIGGRTIVYSPLDGYYRIKKYI
jgi:hypothetical protein